MNTSTVSLLQTAPIPKVEAATELLALIGGPNWQQCCYAQLQRMRDAERDKDRQGDLSLLMADVFITAPGVFRHRAEELLCSEPVDAAMSA